MRDVAQKLRRLLFIVPFVAKHADGVAVDRLAALLGVDRDELLADLDLLSQVGPPDGDPGEYLLVSVEGGRVFVDLAHRLTRPLRLTPAEGCSLLLGIRALRESGIAPFDDAMASAERKLLTALGRDAGEAQSLATSTVVAEPDRVVALHLRDLVTAARKSRRVEIAYVSASRHHADRRVVDPYGIVHHAGEWYLVGHCHQRGDVRTFRIDRVASLTSLDQAFDPPADFDLEAYRTRAPVRAVGRRGDRAGPPRAAGGDPHRRQLAGRRDHAGRGRLGRAAGRLRRLRMGDRLGPRPGPARLDPRARGRPRRHA
jgi:proteasome accessory factor C